MTHRDGEKKQEINEIPAVIEEKIQNESDPMEPNETEIRAHVETKITDERERQRETGGKGKRKIKELNAKYRVKKKGINLVIEELK